MARRLRATAANESRVRIALPEPGPVDSIFPRRQNGVETIPRCGVGDPIALPPREAPIVSRTVA